MATAAIVGRLASIRLSTAAASTATSSQTAIVELKDYTLTVERTAINVTSHDSSGFDENLSGVARWTWEADILHISTGASQGAARAHLLGSNPGLVNITFKQSTSNSAKKFQGKTRLTGFVVGPHDTSGAVLGRLSGVGSGTLTRTG